MMHKVKQSVKDAVKVVRGGAVAGTTVAPSGEASKQDADSTASISTQALHDDTKEGQSHPPLNPTIDEAAAMTAELHGQMTAMALNDPSTDASKTAAENEDEELSPDEQAIEQLLVGGHEDFEGRVHEEQDPFQLHNMNSDDDEEEEEEEEEKKEDSNSTGNGTTTTGKSKESKKERLKHLPKTIHARFVQNQLITQNYDGLQHALSSTVDKTHPQQDEARMFEGGILTTANHKKWYARAIPATWFRKVSNEYHYGNYVIVNRKTKDTTWEDMPIYARIGMHLLFVSTVQTKLLYSPKVQKLFTKESVQQGRHFDAPESIQQIPVFVKSFNLNLTELELDIKDFKTFNEFFYRKLKPSARPIADPLDSNVIVSAADCRLCVFDSIDSATKIWIKGSQFNLFNLLESDEGQWPRDDRVDITPSSVRPTTSSGEPQDAGVASASELAKEFDQGSIAIFRLAPQDYHRFHSPVKATVAEPPRVLGKTYYTVNPMAVRQNLNVFTENVRKLTVLNLNDGNGKAGEDGKELDGPEDIKQGAAPLDRALFISIGALLVGSICLTGAEKAGTHLNKGDELGYFAYGGSTCILLFKKGAVRFDQDLLDSSAKGLETLVRMGERIGAKIQA